MKTIFADTLYWVALINPKDQWHARVMAVGSSIGQARLMTPDEVLVEVLNFYAERGSYARQAAASNCEPSYATLTSKLSRKLTTAFSPVSRSMKHGKIKVIASPIAFLCSSAGIRL